MKCRADVIKFELKRNNSNDGTTAAVDIGIGVDRKQAEQQFGKALEVLAFSTMQKIAPGSGKPPKKGEKATGPGAEQTIYLQDLIKPNKRVKPEKHVIDIEGHQIEVTPELFGVRPIEGAERAVVILRIPIDAKNRKLKNVLTEKDMVDVEFNPIQLTAPGVS